MLYHIWNLKELDESEKIYMKKYKCLCLKTNEPVNYCSGNNYFYRCEAYGILNTDRVVFFNLYYIFAYHFLHSPWNVENFLEKCKTFSLYFHGRLSTNYSPWCVPAKILIISAVNKAMSNISYMCSVTPISRSSLTERSGEMTSWPCLSYMSTEKVVSLAAEVPPDPEFKFIMRRREAEKTIL